MMCNPLRLTVLVVGLVSFSSLAESVLGAPTVFFARDNNDDGVVPIPFPKSQGMFDRFTSSLNAFGVDDIEDQNPTLDFGATGITATAPGATPFFNGRFGIDSASLVENENLGMPLSNTIFDFDQHITAFGLFVIQGGDEDLGDDPVPNHNNNPTTFVLRDTVNNLEVNVPIQIGPDWGFFNMFFLGVHDTVPFNQVEIIESIDAEDGMNYDNVVAGFVPEPGSFALVMLGGACALCRRTRFRRG